MARGKKFIPDSDTDFAHMARNFAQRVAEQPALYGIRDEDAQAIAQAVAGFRDAMARNYQRFTRSQQTVLQKDQTRATAERLIRRAAHVIRGNAELSAADKVLIGMRERPTRLRRRGVPDTAPRLAFVSDVHGSVWNGGVHVISFCDSDRAGRAKPEGAARLELYFDQLPPHEPIPVHPGQRNGGKKWFLRSYTRSPIRVEYPRSDAPMRVVYWACWANTTGEQGPFSPTLVAPIEGMDWSKLSLPAPAPEHERGQAVLITRMQRELPSPESEAA
jgi:hypothetical protein